MNEFWKKNLGGIASAGASIGGGILGMLGQNARATKQHNRQKELMGIQFENQKLLNQQGHDLQMEMWKNTNHPAQVKMLQEAGLNPALMYGMGGGGSATTGSQGGGSAAGGQAHAPMDIGQILNATKLKAEIDNINANTNLTNEKSESEGVTREKIRKDMEMIESNISVNASKILVNQSEIEKNESIIKLNKSITDLNTAKEQEAVANTKLVESDLEWQKKTGLHKNDPMVAKTVKYLAEQTGLSEKQIIGLVGGAFALERLVNALGGKFLGNMIDKMGKSPKKIGY